MPATLEKKPMAKKIEVELTTTAIVEVPMIPALTATEFVSTQIEPHLSRQQAQTLKRIFKELEQSGAKYKTRSGERYVTKPCHVVNWLMDQVTVSAG
jgi:hypothetical protein